MNEIITLTPARLPDRVTIPAVITHAGGQAEKRFIEFFTAQIRNPNTRKAYGRAAGQFFTWCQAFGLSLADIQPVHVAAYIEAKQKEVSILTVKQHLAALKHLFDWLVIGQVISINPAAAVRGPKYSIKTGKTPILSTEDARQLFEAIPETLSGIRDRALIGVMVYSFARVSAVVTMKVGDYFPSGKRWRLRVLEKGGKYRELPVHHKAESYLDAYLEAAGIRSDLKGPLFRSMERHKGGFTANPLDRRDVYRMIRRRCGNAELPETVFIGCHSMRGTGITNYLDNGGLLETAQEMAGHASTRTTQLYDRRNQQVELAEIERVRI